MNEPSFEIKDTPIMRKFYKTNHLTAWKFLQVANLRFFQFAKLTTNKIKIIAKLKYLNHPIFEFKLLINHQAYRVAYIHYQNRYEIIYASKTILKQEFVKELNKTHLVD